MTEKRKGRSILLKEQKRGRRRIATVSIRAGMYLEFNYNDKQRTVVVIAADNNGNMDAYEVTESDRDLLVLEVMSRKEELLDGDLWSIFGSGKWPYKFFNRKKIHSPTRVWFETEEVSE